MYQKYLKFEKNLYKIEMFIVTVAFTTIFITVVLQVFQRFFNLPIPDTSEISMVGQAVFAFFSVSMLVYSGEHITIEAHKMIKNENIVISVEILAYVFQIIFAFVFIWLGYDLLGFAIKSGSATTALRVPLWIPYGSFFIGMLLLVIHTIGSIWQRITNRKKVASDDNIDVESRR